MSEIIISGIQQIGIGVSNVYEAWEWYRKNLGMDLAVFDEAAQAELMLPYTEGEPRSRHAVLALNYRGGSGLEIWQYTSRTPQPANFDIQLGDLGILAIKYKCPDINESYRDLTNNGVNIVSSLGVEDSRNTFFARDPYGNLLEMVEDKHWFKNAPGNGGVFGCTIGVSDMKKAIEFYQNYLGYDSIQYEKSGSFNDFNSIDNTSFQYERVILTHTKKKTGPFADLFGPSEIELVKVLDRQPKKVYENRMWGDLGYIHLCFDVWGMDALKEKAASRQHPFTVDSANSFDMGEAAGRFTYTEDPDGTLIEFVETHKIPIMKKLGWYFDLRNRDHHKSLPKYLLKAMFLNRSKKPVYPR